MRVCPHCGEENPERARFCLACATPLETEARAAAREVRKTVTLLFSDVTGSTALGERLDPESLRRVMSRYFDEMRRILVRHGGTVEKFVGDAVMAVFGIPVLHEDDALRAVRAAAEMREALARLNEEFERRWGARLEVRTGVNTGEVVAGDPSRGEAFATGDAVNVASRLEHAAQPGEILIGDSTYRLVRDAVRAEPLEPLALKGKGQPTRAHRLLEVLPGAPAHARRLDAPMVGRERERRRLRDAFDQAVGDASCHLFTVLGSAGVGKSRLVEEFLADIGDEAIVLRGRCLPYGEAITFWPVAEAVKQALGGRDPQSAEEARAGIESLLADDPDRAVIARRVVQLLGLENSASDLEESFWAVRRLLEAAARRRPLVVVFDDIHWGESTFLDLVEHVADWSRGAPILLVCVARPELMDARPSWGGGKLNATSVLLEPLSEEECESLVDNLLGEIEGGDAVRERIAEAAEGNPLFVEEMLAMLIDDGVLERRNGHWATASDLSRIVVPPSIQALLAARLDRLHAGDRLVIERASVEGKVFHRGAVDQLSPPSERREIGARLMTLVRKELVRPDRARFAGEDAYRFRHLLIRDAAYEAMPKEARADLHARFAGWLEQRTGERAIEHAETIGYHLEQAFRYREQLGVADEEAHRLAARAAEQLVAAGRRAVARGDYPGAVGLLERAASLLPETDPQLPQLLVELAELLFRESGGLARAEALFGEAHRLASAAGDARLAARARVGTLQVQLHNDPEGRTVEARLEAERVIPLFEQAGDEGGLARAWQLAGAEDWFRCRLRAWRQKGERALEYARRAGEAQLEGQLVWDINASHVIGPTPLDETVGRIDRLLEAARREGNVIREAYFLTLRGWADGWRGRFGEARAALTGAASVFDELGVRRGRVQIHMGELEMLAGNLAAAEETWRAVYERFDRAGDKGTVALVAPFLAGVLVEQGRYGEAERFAAVGEQAAASDDVVAHIFLRVVRARIAVRQGSARGAESLAREAVALADETDLLIEQGEARLALAEALRAADRTDEAEAAAREAVERFREKGSLPMVEKARRFLAELDGKG